MTYIIGEACIDVKDISCQSVCPVDCIHEVDRMLVIDAEECIDCGACEPECPWQAIYEESAVPDLFKDDIPLNHATVDLSDQFKVKGFVQIEHPTPEKIVANKRKWGMEEGG